MSSEPISSRRQQTGTAPSEALAEPALKPAPDLLLEGELFWDKYKVPVLAVLALVLLGLIGSEVYRANREKSLAQASTELDSAKTLDDYKKIIAEHDGSLAAAGAYMLAGRMQMNGKDYAGAAETWTKFADKYPTHTMAPNALVGAAGAFQSLGKFDQARSLYQRVQTAYAKSYLAPLASLSEGSMLKAQGKIEDARHVYENIMARAPQSDAARQATESLRLLKAIPSLPANPAPAPAVSATLPTPIVTPAAAPAGAAPAPDGGDAPSAVAAPFLPATTATPPAEQASLPAPVPTNTVTETTPPVSVVPVPAASPVPVTSVAPDASPSVSIAPVASPAP